MAVSINSDKRVRDVVVIGASAGGLPAITKLLSALPSGFPAVVGIVIHRGAHALSNWSRTFGRHSSLKVVEPQHGERLEKGVAYLAPADKHMTFKHGCAYLDHSDKRHFTRPAVDPLFESAALAYASRVVGVVLTGCGRDGTCGLLDIAAAGGMALVQAPLEAEFADMPVHALLRDHVEAALTLDQIAEVLPRLAQGAFVQSV